ncbi:hypothetical protein BB559_000126 [Furculomyces boomerangus]|uniref:Inner membrane component domain-containing protein n=2 Tax=Harpellales TaxID=61421 RepID=A0A2T9Z681_9FUNG|nr:hypothetical protein BB559_000126 [Furculomyces boomerangus]PWA03345.1 hypothetical protein BB558_000469 [Smittium angustum]
MSGVISLLGNIIWIVFGGWIYALGYFLVGLLFMITIIGIPFGIALWRLARLAILPFGKRIEVEKVTGLRILFNVIWLLTLGWIVVLAHLFTAFAYAITIIGIPFAIQDLKLAKVALWPLGTVIDSQHV